LKTNPSRSSKVKNLQKFLIELVLNLSLKTFQMKTKNQVMIAQRKNLEDISNEGKESCDDVGKKEDLEDISN
jgi:hypothetical protein